MGRLRQLARAGLRGRVFLRMHRRVPHAARRQRRLGRLTPLLRGGRVRPLLSVRDGALLRCCGLPRWRAFHGENANSHQRPIEYASRQSQTRAAT